jgi:hypothetical protein
MKSKENYLKIYQKLPPKKTFSCLKWPPLSVIPQIYAIETAKEVINVGDLVVDATFWHDYFCVCAKLPSLMFDYICFVLLLDNQL